ncbi:MAG: hypothetical protein HGA85_01935, partial [Nanoarchaeota archaeon]|nr:hypothetical protein [Nanoarchaeota archaeon]
MYNGKGLIFYADIGHGFRSPAEAISKALTQSGFDSRAANFFLELKAKATEDILKNSWKLLLNAGNLFDILFPVTNTSAIKPFEKLFYARHRNTGLVLLEKEKPDFIICPLPFATNFFSRLVKDNGLDILVFGYNADVILSHKAYICNEVTDYFVSTKQGYSMMVKDGQAKSRLSLVGYPIDNKYCREFDTVSIERRKLGLADRFTVLIVFGGDGIGASIPLIRELVRDGIQCVVVCGRNSKLKKDIDTLKDPNLKVLGFVTNLQDYMYSADLVAGKSGLNLVFESIFMKKPFCVLKAMTNEKFAARMIVKDKIGAWPKNRKEAAGFIRRCRKDWPYFCSLIENIRNIKQEFGPEKMVQVVRKALAVRKVSQLKNKKVLLFD